MIPETEPPESVLAGEAGGEGSWGVEAIGAPAAWQQGFDGTGVVVGAIDSGATAVHEQLAAGFRGGDRSWLDPANGSAESRDTRFGHGTGVLSCAVGRNAAGITLGVAPGAQWIACAGLPEGRYNNVLATRCADWMLNVGQPDVLVAAWVLPRTGEGCDRSLQPIVDAWRAAEILPVFPAGNFGPEPRTDRSPANYNSLYPDGRTALSIGGLGRDGGLIAESSRGPGGCDGAVFPLLVAPAEDLFTAFPLSSSTYLHARGTSFAAGLAAGAAAILIQADPEASISEIEDALLAGAADLGPPGADSTFGYGRLDIPGALKALNLVKKGDLRRGAAQPRRGADDLGLGAGSQILLQNLPLDRQLEAWEGGIVGPHGQGPPDLALADLLADDGDGDETALPVLLGLDLDIEPGQVGLGAEHPEAGPAMPADQDLSAAGRGVLQAVGFERAEPDPLRAGAHQAFDQGPHRDLHRGLAGAVGRYGHRRLVAAGGRRGIESDGDLIAPARLQRACLRPDVWVVGGGLLHRDRLLPMVDQDQLLLSPFALGLAQEIDAVARQELEDGDHPALKRQDRHRRLGIIGVDADGELALAMGSGGVERQTDPAAPSRGHHLVEALDGKPFGGVQPLEDQIGPAVVLDREGVLDALALDGLAEVVDPGGEPRRRRGGAVSRPGAGDGQEAGGGEQAPPQSSEPSSPSRCRRMMGIGGPPQARKRS